MVGRCVQPALGPGSASTQVVAIRTPCSRTAVSSAVEWVMCGSATSEGFEKARGRVGGLLSAEELMRRIVRVP